jgi:hypothetical protein
MWIRLLLEASTEKERPYSASKSSESSRVARRFIVIIFKKQIIYSTFPNMNLHFVNLLGQLPFHGA